MELKNIPGIPGANTGRPDKSSNKDLKSLRKSCREFEAIYIQEMYKAMRKTVPDGGIFEKDMASELYKEMLDMEMAKTTAAGKGTGIGEAMYQQLKNKLEHKK
jgi:flagellar protein FlgJ